MTQPRLVGGRYELGELVGYGGMAEVHRGRDTRLNRDVAIKVLRADLARDPSFINRFRREAHSAAGLNHPSIVSVYDTGEDSAPDGTALPFIVMEYVEGRTLREVLKSEGRLPVRRAMEITADVCSALDFSHRNGIIHRDIKPANVMITPAGAVKVMDFGIARAVADTSATQTQTANVIGTAQYLSPEQARGESVDARSDVYSTGCLLYELVTGVPPFQGDSPVAVAYQHVRENPVAPSSRNPEVPRALDSIVMKALAKNQLNRYQSAGEMRSDLQRALANQPVQAEAVMTDDERTQLIARPLPPVAPLRRSSYVEEDDDNSRRTGLIWAAVVLVLLLVIGLGSFLIFGSSSGDKKVKTAAVPSVVGQTPDTAVSAIQKAGFVAKAGTATPGPCDNGVTVNKGYVCKVSPAAGTELKEGDTVTYQVFTPQLVPVPFVEGGTYDAAVAELTRVGLKAARKDINQFDGKGYVLKQDTPAGMPVAPGTTVILEVPTGKQQLPNVVGQTLGDAESNLTSAGFSSDKINSDQTRVTTDPTKNGKVAKMNPKGGGYYTQDQVISLVIYKYVAPKPSCTTPPPSPPSSPSPGAGSSSSSSTATGPSGGPSGASSSTALPACPTKTP